MTADKKTRKTPAAKARTRAKAGTSKQASIERRALFVEAYIANGGNATEAAITAGYSPKTAASQASRLLKDVKIQAQISERSKEVADKYKLTTELVIKSIVQELSFDPAKLYRPDGSLKDVTELDADTRMALASVEFEQVGENDSPVTVRKVKWANRNQAREQAMKHLGMFERDNGQKGEGAAKALAEFFAQIYGDRNKLPIAAD
jgi:phage terminase small subunit